jgi:hypothetical protein
MRLNGSLEVHLSLAFFSPSESGSDSNLRIPKRKTRTIDLRHCNIGLLGAFRLFLRYGNRICISQ